jgi:hypothetical protein
MSDDQTIESRDEAMRDTAKHIARVGALMADAIGNLAQRSAAHDLSKYGPEEWPTFARITHDLRGLSYGSEEYRAQLRAHRPAIEHHQTTNSHHPEYHDNGVAGMSLFDLIEMLCDWKAAGERHDDGSISRSIETNTERFDLSPQLVSILDSTARELGWI